MPFDVLKRTGPPKDCHRIKSPRWLKVGDPVWIDWDNGRYSEATVQEIDLGVFLEDDGSMWSTGVERPHVFFLGDPQGFLGALRRRVYVWWVMRPRWGVTMGFSKKALERIEFT